MIYLGADHRGFKLKEKIKSWLIEDNLQFEDCGAQSFDPSDDYPIFAQKVAQKIQKTPNSSGILMCGSGVGVDVVANKFNSIRSSIGKNADQVKKGREDDNMNVLVLAADFTTDEEAKNMIKVFLSSKFNNIENHTRRLNEINAIEESQQ